MITESFWPLSCFFVSLVASAYCFEVVARPLLMLKQPYPTFYVNKNLESTRHRAGFQTVTSFVCFASSTE